MRGVSAVIFIVVVFLILPRAPAPTYTRFLVTQDELVWGRIQCARLGAIFLAPKRLG